MAEQQDYQLSSEQTKIVGDKGCEFGTIILAISKNEAAEASLKTGWKQLARELKIKQIDVMDLEEDMTFGKKRLLDTVDSILLKWRSKNANKATLRSLITSCNNIELEDVATVLETIQTEILQ